MAGIETLSWVDGDTITAEKLQSMVQELRKLSTDIPSVKIQDQRNAQVITNIGNNLRIVAGSTFVSPNPNSQIVRERVLFGANSFSPGNAPIVLAQLATTDRVRAFCTVSGPNFEANDPNPTNSGFSFWVAHQVLPPNAEGVPQQLTIATTQLVFWIAIGY